jgi:hypothetical protein
MNLRSDALGKIDELELRGDIEQWTSDEEENAVRCARCDEFIARAF